MRSVFCLWLACEFALDDLAHTLLGFMQGYYKDEKSAKEAIKNGLLYTGDLGFAGEEGKLHITGRKKEMLVLPSGTKIFLPEYEEKLSLTLANPELAVILLDDKPALYIQRRQTARRFKKNSQRLCENSLARNRYRI